MIVASSQRLLAATGAAARVRAVAITGQYASTVPVDDEGRPTGPCLTWLDTRGGRYSRPAIGGAFQGYNARKALQFVRRTGGGPSPTGADPVGQILYLLHEERDAVSRTRWFMEPVDYLTMRFCGVASATHASRFALWMTDNRHLDRYEYDGHLASLVGIDTKYLPPLLPFGSVIGNVTPSVGDGSGRRSRHGRRHGSSRFSRRGSRRGGDSPLRHPSRSVDDVLDQLSVAEEENRHRALHRRRARTLGRLVSHDQLTRHGRQVTGVAPGRTGRGGTRNGLHRDDGTRRDLAAGVPRRSLHALAGRRTFPRR